MTILQLCALTPFNRLLKRWQSFTFLYWTCHLYLFIFCKTLIWILDGNMGILILILICLFCVKVCKIKIYPGWLNFVVKMVILAVFSNFGQHVLTSIWWYGSDIVKGVRNTLEVSLFQFSWDYIKYSLRKSKKSQGGS